MNDGDGHVGEVEGGVEGCDFGVVPGFDFAEIDGGDNVAVEVEIGLEARKVVDHDDGTGDGGEMEDGGRGFLFLVGGHGGVGAGEVDGAVGDSLDSSSRADSLIINFHIGVGLVVGVDPLGVEGSGEGSAGTLDLGFGESGGCEGNNEGGGADETGFPER